MKKQKLIISCEAKGFQLEVDKYIRDGWFMRPESLNSNLSAPSNNCVYHSYVVILEKEFYELQND